MGVECPQTEQGSCPQDHFNYKGHSFTNSHVTCKDATGKFIPYVDASCILLCACVFLTFATLQEGILKGVVSQNTDGLHKRSGLPKKGAHMPYLHILHYNFLALFELHGNSNLEKCEKCHHEYLRDYRCSVGLRNHLTGRKCDDSKCKGNLKDTIIHFGETLPVGKLLQHTIYVHVTFLRPQIHWRLVFNMQL